MAQNTPKSQMEKLDRGLIALPAQSGTGNFISWRSLGTDDDSQTQFEILRNGESLAKGLYATNYTDAQGKRTDTYQIVTYVGDKALPEGVTDLGGKCDIYVKNTSGCHIYSIEAVVADDATAISEASVHSDGPAVIYNLSGQRIARPQKGVYIVNGRKYLGR